MANRDLQVEARERRRERRSGITVDEHHVGPLGLEHGLELQQHVAGDVEQGLARLHDGQVVVGDDPEHAKHLVEHLAVLAGNGHDRFELLGARLQLVDERTHLDCLRSGAEDEHHFSPIHFSRYLSLIVNQTGLRPPARREPEIVVPFPKSLL